MPLTDGVINGMLNHTCRGASYAQPTAWYVQLHYGSPGTDGTLNAHLAAMRPQVEDWSTPTTGETHNATDMEFVNVPPLPPPYEAVSHITIWSSLHWDTLLATISLQQPRLLYGGEIFTIETGQLSVSVT